ncbi:MAG: biotin-dependent carboxyltransferase family protein [Rhodobacteraceae bacterium]|nr:biotin-dependent carboxyltransferase family protein [Paracoccaceae bacterium]
MSVQDRGRAGTLALGLAAGGAADPLALTEAAVLLGHALSSAALEMAAQGGRFEATGDLRIALTGAPMRAAIDGNPVVWNASHPLRGGQILDLGAATSGIYGYLSVGGGLETAAYLGSRSVHPAAGIGRLIAAGDLLPCGADTGGPTGRGLAADDRFSGGTIRVVAGPQTALFDKETLDRFAATTFTRDPRGNRQGARLGHDGLPFAAAGQLALLSEPILPGDIQMTGDGAPFVLGPDCQTTGGYPRIGTVVPDDLPRALQARPGALIRFVFVERRTALQDFIARRRAEERLAADTYPLVRDPADIPDLLTRQLIGGVTTGEDALHDAIGAPRNDRGNTSR